MKDILTNGDYIRQLIARANNQELAKVILPYISCCVCCPAFKSCSVAPFRFEYDCTTPEVPHVSEDCRKNFQNWLGLKKEENK